MAAYLDFLLPSWSCKSFFYAPSISVKSLSDCGSFESCPFRPFNKGERFSFMGDSSVRRRIPMLLLNSFPSNILRLIVSIIVDSSKGMFFARSKTNIFKKISKFFPSFTNSNSPSSIMRVSVHRWISASPNHRMPSSPFFGSVWGSTMTMFDFHNYSCDVECEAILHSDLVGG